MKRLFLLCLGLVVMTVIIAGMQGCTSTGKDYSTGLNEKDYNTYDYQGNRLERNEGESSLSRGFNRY